MSAIEMMDPKMDAGMICNRSSNTPLSFEEAVATGHLVLSKEELTWADMVGFIWIWLDLYFFISTRWES